MVRDGLSLGVCSPSHLRTTQHDLLPPEPRAAVALQIGNGVIAPVTAVGGSRELNVDAPSRCLPTSSMKFATGMLIISDGGGAPAGASAGGSAASSDMPGRGDGPLSSELKQVLSAIRRRGALKRKCPRLVNACRCELHACSCRHSGSHFATLGLAAEGLRALHNLSCIGSMPCSGSSAAGADDMEAVGAVLDVDTDQHVHVRLWCTSVAAASQTYQSAIVGERSGEDISNEHDDARQSDSGSSCAQTSSSKQQSEHRHTSTCSVAHDSTSALSEHDGDSASPRRSSSGSTCSTAGSCCLTDCPASAAEDAGQRMTFRTSSFGAIRACHGLSSCNSAHGCTWMAV